MYYLNKIVGGFLNPMGIGLMLMLLSVGFAFLKRRRSSLPASLFPVIGLLGVLWLWVWSCGATGWLIGLPLERAYPPQLAEAMPEAEAIVVLGGGMDGDTNVCAYADLQSAGDRAWHGARLYRAGKAKRVFVTNAEDAELMADLGVPREAIVPPSEARNTEEEARFIASLMTDGKTGGEGRSAAARPRILLVTSAWHMRRAMLMFERYAKGVETVPAATDHEATVRWGDGLEFRDFVPDPVMIGFNAYRFKEYLAYYAYRFLRR